MLTGSFYCGQESLSTYIANRSGRQQQQPAQDPYISAYGDQFHPDNYLQQFIQHSIGVDQKLDRLLNLFHEHQTKVLHDTSQMQAGINSLHQELESVKKSISDVSSSSSSGSSTRRTIKLPTDLSVF